MATETAPGTRTRAERTNVAYRSGSPAAECHRRRRENALAAGFRPHTRLHLRYYGGRTYGGRTIANLTYTTVSTSARGVGTTSRTSTVRSPPR